MRLPVVLALAMCAGIVSALILRLYGLSAAWLALSFAPAAAVFAVWACLAKKILKPAALVLLPLLLFYCGALCCEIKTSGFCETELQPDTYYRFCGKAVEKGYTSSGEYAVIDGVTANGKKISGKVYVYLRPAYGEIFEAGYTVEFYGEPEPQELFDYGELNFRAEDGIKYFVAVYGGLKSTYGFSLLARARNSLRDILFGNLGYETAAVSYAMLTGNTDYVGERSLDVFRYGGIAHIFAVSGLHIGIIYSIITFICKKLRLNRYLSAAVCTSLILLYSAFCGFTVSSVRAAIMCITATAAKLLLKKNDGLNSLSIAVMIILAYTPLSLFFVGFELSVCATGGIFVFSALYRKAMQRIKIPQKFASAAGVSFGAQTATAPVLLARFGYLSGAGILMNILFIPMLSVIYAVIFVTALVCMIIPPFAPFVLPYSVLPLELFLSVIIGLGFEKALIKGFGAGLFVLLYFISALFLSDKINFKKITRLIALGCSAVILTSYVLFRYAPPQSGYRVIVSAYGSGGEIVIKSRYGTLLVITDDVNAERLESFLNNNYITGVDAIVIVGEDAAETYSRLDTDCYEIRLNDRLPQLQPYGDFLLIYESKFNSCGVDCLFCDNQTLLLNFGGISMGVCSEENYALPNCDIMVTDVQNVFVKCSTEIYFNKKYGEYNVAERGNIYIDVQENTYVLKTQLPPH